MPLDPDIRLMGLSANTAKMFASAVYPCVIEFHEQVEVSAPVASRPAGDGNEVEVEVEVEPAIPAAPPTGQVVQLQWWMALKCSLCLAVKARSHKIMFKSGDDLRQDQLIMQMIALMDRLLKKVLLSSLSMSMSMSPCLWPCPCRSLCEQVNLDLKLLTYGILAVGQKDGTPSPPLPFPSLRLGH